MSETTDRLDEKYAQVYEEEIRGLERRRAHDPSCTIDDITAILQNLYIMDGNNYDGRSELTQASVSATIAAYECFIGEWKKETGK